VSHQALYKEYGSNIHVSLELGEVWESDREIHAVNIVALLCDGLARLTRVWSDRQYDAGFSL